MVGSQRRAAVVGAGLIGGSIGLALRDQGWHVVGSDLDPLAARRGVERGCFDAVGEDPDADLVVIATPVGAVAAAARHALHTSPNAAVTDVGGVKAAIVDAVDHPRFVAGHPMAGSERLGVEGADEELFVGAAWVLTPGPSTSDETYEMVRSVATLLGAQVLTMSGEQHDSLVAVVSHVPHLTAASLVRIARDRSEDHRALLRLAAGGFRDMTRIAAGSPDIWPDICVENRDAILGALDSLRGELDQFRDLVDRSDRVALRAALAEAQAVRRALPTRGHEPTELREVRVQVDDKPGEALAVATLATDLGVNLHSIQTVDAADGPGGTLHLLVATSEAEAFVDALGRAGRVAVLSPEVAEA